MNIDIIKRNLQLYALIDINIDNTVKTIYEVMLFNLKKIKKYNSKKYDHIKYFSHTKKIKNIRFVYIENTKEICVLDKNYKFTRKILEEHSINYEEFDVYLEFYFKHMHNMYDITLRHNCLFNNSSNDKLI